MFERSTLCLLAVLLAAPSFASGQAAAPPSRETQLARGWGELAAGRAAVAAEAAGRLLRVSAGDHDAISLAIAAALAGSRPVPGLDEYERWLATSRREDPFLLEAIGVGTLTVLSRGTEPRVSYAALAALGRHGDAAARQRLAALAADAALPVEAEAALARAGNAAGIQKLGARIREGGPQDKTFAIEALTESGQPGVAQAIAEALRDPGAPSRIAAASALAKLGATEAVPQLKAALGDPEPAVRAMVEIALGLLGDPDHQAAIDGLANSRLADFRLLHARYSAEREPQGAWRGAAEGLLNDPDPAVRLGAAELLLSRGVFDGAARVLSAALDDPSAPVRTMAARLLASVPQTDEGYRLLRKALRDPLDDIRVGAARTLLLSR